MFIDYTLGNKNHTFKQVSEKDLLNLNFLLTNSRGDFLNLGIKSNTCKYQGFNVCKSSTVEIFKFIENIVPCGVDVQRVKYFGGKVERTFKSRYIQELSHTYSDSSIPEDYSNLNSSTTSNFFSKDNMITKDSFIVGPSGGLIYEINNFEGELVIDLDMHKKNDFSVNGREYKTWNDGGVVYVEFTKNNGNYSYKQFMGIKAQNFAYDLVEEFVEKHYEFSRLQKSNYVCSVYRLMKVGVLNNKKLIIGCSFSIEDVNNQIELLEKHQEKIEKVLGDEVSDSLNMVTEFDKPLSSNVEVAYDLSVLATYKFLKVDLDNKNTGVGSFAGFPYFSNVWARDDIFGLRSQINLGDYDKVKSRIDYYLNSIDSKTGGIRNLLSRSSESNCDVVFMLGKRIEDFFCELIEKNLLFKFYTKADIKKIYEILDLSFHNIVKNNWDFNLELIKVSNFRGFRDTLFEKFPLNVQVLFLGFTSCMTFLGSIVSVKNYEIKKYNDFEELLSMKIKSVYVKNNLLYSNLDCDKITYDIFSAYYSYPTLFKTVEWEEIFDRGLIVLQNDWSGISSLSSEHVDFLDSHSGQDGKSRKLGDSFFYMNNIAAICMHDLNEIKYRKYISSILSSSTNDILECGTVGFSSELSSYSEKKSEGNLAQLVSSTSYIEMIDKLFDKN